MKTLLPSLVVGLLLSNLSGAFAQSNLETDPGYLAIDKAIDLKTVRPEVNVNLPRFLLKDAAATLNGGPDDPFAGTGINFADLVSDVKLIRVVVIEAGKTNRAALDKGVKALRTELEAKWTALVTVPEDQVGVYVRSSENGESMAGLAVLIYDGGDAVIANVVGRVSVGKILKIASKMDKLPKDLLRKLSGAVPGAVTKTEVTSDQTPEKPADKAPEKAAEPAPAASK
jgi:hypothetical protein